MCKYIHCCCCYISIWEIIFWICYPNQLGIVGKLNFTKLFSSSLLKGCQCQRCFVCHKVRSMLTVLCSNNNINLSYFCKNLRASGEDRLRCVDLTDVEVHSQRNEVIWLCSCSEQPAVKNRTHVINYFHMKYCAPFWELICFLYEY